MPEPAKPSPSLPPASAQLSATAAPAGDHVSLRTALAMMYADDLEDGLAALDAAIARATQIPSVRRKVRLKTLALQLSLPLALAGLVVAGADLFDPTLPVSAFTLLAGLVAVPPLVLGAWQVWQYGAGFPAKPLPLAHDADPKIETAFAQLQKETGPAVWRRVSFSGRLERADRHLFFGRLRYLLLSQDFAVRRQVSGFPLPFKVTGDLFVARIDAEHLRSLVRPKRRGGPGRDPKYPYVEAVIAILCDPAIIRCNLADQTGAVRAIEQRLTEWFEEHADETGAVPRKDLIRPYAIKVFEGLSKARTAH